MKRTILLVLLGTLLSACAKQAFVDLQNAPVADSNINSRRTAFGDVYLIDLKSGTFNYRGNLVEEDQADRLDIIPASKGNYSESASSNISIKFKGNIQEIKPEITAQITSSLIFSMKKHNQKRFRYPDDVLNAKEVAKFRSNQSPFANDNFRFLFVNQVFSGEKIEYKFNKGKEDGGKFILDVAGQKVEVFFNNSAELICEGDDNACVVSVQVWKLVPNPGGATGYKFVLDTEREAQVVFQGGV
ncbi:hypothetical protein K1718_27360 (plasmid) [Roseibium porphyridii]|uniref:Lipoprotein n=1 Tax=Roseibium porphyridii TaxID=2866279 RepID=A0ABY8FB12_9HYPH|nr:hypothetical protein [Roseibium sp. KMA01]WFE92647.1 hypothetical protein K1718_27360 [Roseibium sp. KMA01]